MRILHCCLAAFYIDDYGYQENILPQMHKFQGHQVCIVASTETYINNTTLGYIEPKSYYTKQGIPIIRLPYVKWLPHFIVKKIRIYKNLSKIIEDFEPEIFFIHDCQFVSILTIAVYVKKHPKVRVYIDGHADFINSARNWVSKNILHKIIYKWCVKKIEPYTTKFYGVLPIRVDFFKNVYKTPPYKTELLPLGVNNTIINLKEKEKNKEEIRLKYKINSDDLVIITGGKIDRRKNIHILIKAINELNIDNIKLLIFGAITTEMESEIAELSNNNNIINVGWLAPEEVNRCILASDIAIFPGTHSVLWEQAVGLGIPCIFKKWQGIDHVDLGGNCLFLENADLIEIKETIKLICTNDEIVAQMRKVAEEKGTKVFSYYEIAERAINQ